jgi:hypothetical protein
MVECAFSRCRSPRVCAGTMCLFYAPGVCAAKPLAIVARQLSTVERRIRIGACFSSQ